MSLSDLPSELGERGIWWQVAGFAIVGGVSVAVLQIWEGSNFWVYRSFEIAAKDLYWLFILPLAGAIEGARKMFEKASEIRAAQRAKMMERARRQGRKEGQKAGREEGREEGREQAMAEIRGRLLQAAEQFQQRDPQTEAVILTPEVMDYLFGDSSDRDD